MISKKYQKMKPLLKRISLLKKWVKIISKDLYLKEVKIKLSKLNYLKKSTND